MNRKCNILDYRIFLLGLKVAKAEKVEAKGKVNTKVEPREDKLEQVAEVRAWVGKSTIG